MGGPLDHIYRYLTKETYSLSQGYNNPDIDDYKKEVTITDTYFRDGLPSVDHHTTEKVTPEGYVSPQPKPRGFQEGPSQSKILIPTNTPIEYVYNSTGTRQWWSIDFPERQTGIHKQIESFKLTDRVTLQEMWKNHFKKTTWIKNPDFTTGRNYIWGRNSFSGGDPIRNQIISEAWVSYGRELIEKDLQSLSWRWIRYNPFEASGYDYTVPPITYQKQFDFIVYQTDSSSDATTTIPDGYKTKVKGSFKIDCKGGDGSGWHTIASSLYSNFKVDNPPDFETLNFKSNASSRVTFSQSFLASAVDANRDGEITFDEKDKTTAEKPYKFWINDDRDIEHEVDKAIPPFGHNGDNEEDDVNSDEQAEPDCDVPGLKFRRDLEDLTRISVNLVGVLDLFLGNDSAVALKVRIDADMGTPKVNLFQAVETEGGMEFLKDEATGYNQLQGNYGQELCKVTGSSSVEVPRRTWEYFYGTQKLHLQKLNLLFEGVAEGNGKLVFEVWKDGAKVYELPPIHLMLRKAKAFYETWTVGDSTESANIAQSNDYSIWPESSAQWELGTGSALVPPTKQEEKDYIMFVHGWNMSPTDKTQYADTMYKRLWHQGYKGRFGAYRWPTFFTPNVQLNNFNGSEQRAWNSGAQLADLIRTKSQTFNKDGKSSVHLYGHSMGNIVCSEALRTLGKDAPVKTYISGQSALAAHCWDNREPTGNAATSGPRLMPISLANVTATANIYSNYWHSTASPNFPADWSFNARPSYMNYSYMPSGVKYVNHHNIDDWALNIWELNQQLKPTFNYSYESLSFSALEKAFYRREVGAITSRKVPLSFPEDRFEVFSWAAEARSFATGAEPVTGGLFSESVNLRAAPYNFDDKHKGHSAQFRSTIQKRWVYWREFLRNCDITSIP